MSNYLNYLVEANLSLVLFFTAYALLLRKETDFKIQRLFLLAGIIGSLTFPLIHISYYQSRIPSLSELIPTYLLPELTIGSDEPLSGTQSLQDPVTIRFLVGLFYIAGLLFFLARFVLQLLQLTRKMNFSTSYRIGECNVVESADSKHTFSFFNFIFLGQSDALTADEKAKVIQHETVHARQLHSCDLLLINVVGIFFWFNPLLRFYKKTLIQLHEFEADARAVGNRDANGYCSLLAKVALQSADFTLANHFNSSLTLKRITMMRTIKQKMKRWKIVVLASAIPIVFFIVACQDQVMNNIQEIAKLSTPAPAYVQDRFDQLVIEKTGSHYVLLEFYEESKQEETTQLLQELENKYGLPKSIELYTPDSSHEPLIGKSEAGVVIESMSSAVHTFAILEYRGLAEAEDDMIYDVVDETAMPVGGLPQFYEYVAKNLRYPAEARKKGIEGKVFVEFIVDTKGDVDVTGVSGIGAECDAEVMRVVQSSPKWIPGKNNNIPVKQKMILPITFRIAGSANKDVPQTPDGSLSEIVVAGVKPK